MTGHENATPQVVGIFIADNAGEPVKEVSPAMLIAGQGIDGDRYVTRRGYWSDRRWPDQELTLVESELETEMGLETGSLRRNIVTRGVQLSGLIGQQFEIGEALLEGVRPCDPCKHVEEANRPGLLRDLQQRGGLRARILRGGRIAAGDTISVRGATPSTAG